jgi:hypothetical protein
MSDAAALIVVATALKRQRERVTQVDAKIDQLQRLPGPEGKDGEPGPAGRDGLNGQDGKDGRDGQEGKDGQDGKNGQDGKDGKDGQDGKPPEHQWRGSKLRFRQPDGDWGKYTDLQGDPGKDGKTGVIIQGGNSSGNNLAELPELPDAAQLTDFLLLERNGTAYRVPLSALQTLLGTASPTTTSGEPLITAAGNQDVIYRTGDNPVTDFITTTDGNIVTAS